jgi:uncharacterized membrane protein
MTYEIFKILHFLSLLLGGAATIAPVILLRSVQKTAPPELPAAVPMTMRALGLTGLLAIILLWISGMAMYGSAFANSALGPWFVVKLIATTIVLVVSSTLNLRASRVARGGTPFAPSTVQGLMMILRLSLLIAIVCAVFAFS